MGSVGGYALVQHLNSRVQIPCLPLPAWAMLAKWLTPWASASSPKIGTDVSPSLSVLCGSE